MLVGGKMEEKKLPSEEFKHMDFYEESAKTAEIPNDTLYNFLYERNKNYMDYIAIEFANLKITYEELHTRIDEYARALYKRGVREGDIIMISVANTPEAVFLAYALNKLGAIVCPISPLENEYKILNDLKLVKPKMFIGINDAYKNFKNASRKFSEANIDVILFPAVASIDNKMLHTMYGAKQFIDGNMLLASDHRLLKVLEKGKDYADTVFPSYKPGTTSDIMFTGGSSGIHKGTDLDGNGLNAVVRSLDYVLPLKPGETFLGNLPQFMAFGKLSLHYALCKSLNVGLTMKAMPKDFAGEIYRLKPNGAFGGPIQWESLVRHVISQIDNPDLQHFDKLKNSDGGTYKEYLKLLKEELMKMDKKNLDLSFLKLPVSGGEQLKSFSENVCSLVLQELGAPDELWNGLGMTEMWAPISVKRGKINSTGTVGTIIPFNNYKIVDPNSYEELDYNQPGLLLVNGPGMMKGYYQNQEETDKVILKDNNGVKWLMTGDIALALPNGEIKYIDRAKRCFVCGVENIYPQQIENLLSEFAEIRETIVTKIKDEQLQYVPKYHISLNDPNVDFDKLEAKINKTIEKTLGKSATARYVEFYLEPLPRTANGKLDPKPLQQKDDEIYRVDSKKLVK